MIKSKKMFKSVWICAIIAVVVGALILARLILLWCVKYLDNPKETTEYNDYVPLPLNVTYVEPEIDLKQYTYLDNRSHRFEYHKLNGLPLADFVGVNAVKIVFFRDSYHNIVFANPKNNFDIWNDWTIKEIRVECGEKSNVTDEIEVKNDFLCYVREFDDNLADGETGDFDTATEKAVLRDHVSGGFCDLFVTFQESEYVKWKAEIVYHEYPNDVFEIEAIMLLFSPSYPNIEVDYVEIPMGTSLHDFIVESIKNRK